MDHLGGNEGEVRSTGVLFNGRIHKRCDAKKSPGFIGGEFVVWGGKCRRRKRVKLIALDSRCPSARLLILNCSSGADGSRPRWCRAAPPGATAWRRMNTKPGGAPDSSLISTNRGRPKRPGGAAVGGTDGWMDGCADGFVGRRDQRMQEGKQWVREMERSTPRAMSSAFAHRLFCSLREIDFDKTTALRC